MGLAEPMGRGRPRRNDSWRRATLAARAAVLTALVGLLAACGSSGSSAGSGTSASATATKSGTASTASAAFVNIIEQCYENKTENTDVAIDAAQLAHYQSASAAEQTTILAQDSAWLAARQPVCAAAFNTGGTIDGISAASCLLAESTARLDTVKGIIPPVTKLKFTDSQDPNEMSWYTTPEGSRITMTSTQGDETGGTIIAWTIIGGADGFVVNPKQFYYQDGSFTDPGIVGPPDPTYHRVATGKEFQFGIDYSKLRNDPNKSQTGSVYLYAPGSPAAEWGAP
jgi:uncharacterized protein YecT (DUF1311 family)